MKASLFPMNRANILRAGVTLAIAGVLAYAGLLKINDPAPVSDYLVELIAYRIVGIGRAIGFLEIALALWLISGVGRRWAAASAALLFTAFAVTHLYAASSGVESTCGCLGKKNWFASMPTWSWVTTNMVLAAIAVAVGAGSSPKAGNRAPLTNPVEGEAP